MVPALTEIYTLSLHDALPIFSKAKRWSCAPSGWPARSRTMSSSATARAIRSEEHTSELQSQSNLVCRLLLEKKKKKNKKTTQIKNNNKHNTHEIRQKQQ